MLSAPTWRSWRGPETSCVHAQVVRGDVEHARVTRDGRGRRVELRHDQHSGRRMLSDVFGRSPTRRWERLLLTRMPPFWDPWEASSSKMTRGKGLGGLVQVHFRPGPKPAALYNFSELFRPRAAAHARAHRKAGHNTPYPLPTRPASAARQRESRGSQVCWVFRHRGKERRARAPWM